mmetsp:Transcript_16644/g.34383  ORF Transcript_16644/g.34383 Transcript_16644/m.34383 type:complete len:205 (-) Transcript_16644:300-914(-)
MHRTPPWARWRHCSWPPTTEHSGCSCLDSRAIWRRPLSARRPARPGSLHWRFACHWLALFRLMEFAQGVANLHGRCHQQWHGCSFPHHPPRHCHLCVLALALAEAMTLQCQAGPSKHTRRPVRWHRELCSSAQCRPKMWRSRVAACCSGGQGWHDSGSRHLPALSTRGRPRAADTCCCRRPRCLPALDAELVQQVSLHPRILEA